MKFLLFKRQSRKPKPQTGGKNTQYIYIYIFAKGPVQRIHKEFFQLNNKRQHNFEDRKNPPKLHCMIPCM